MLPVKQSLVDKARIKSSHRPTYTPSKPHVPRHPAAVRASTDRQPLDPAPAPDRIAGLCREGQGSVQGLHRVGSTACG